MHFILDDEQGEDPSIEVSNSQPSQLIYEKESNIKLDYSELEEGMLIYTKTVIHVRTKCNLMYCQFARF